jgi:hypothetical protein
LLGDNASSSILGRYNLYREVLVTLALKNLLGMNASSGILGRPHSTSRVKRSDQSSWKAYLVVIGVVALMMFLKMGEIGLPSVNTDSREAQSGKEEGKKEGIGAQVGGSVEESGNAAADDVRSVSHPQFSVFPTIFF